MYPKLDNLLQKSQALSAAEEVAEEPKKISNMIQKLETLELELAKNEIRAQYDSTGQDLRL